MTVHVFYSSDHPIRCPECAVEINSHLGLPVEQRPQPEQAVTVCPTCSGVWIYCERNGKLALRAPSPVEMARLMSREDILTEAVERRLARE